MDRTTSVAKVQMVALPDGERTWTVVDGGHLVVAPAEEFLEFLRATGRSPNTVKSYARVRCGGSSSARTALRGTR